MVATGGHSGLDAGTVMRSYGCGLKQPDLSPHCLSDESSCCSALESENRLRAVRFRSLNPSVRLDGNKTGAVNNPVCPKIFGSVLKAGIDSWRGGFQKNVLRPCHGSEIWSYLHIKHFSAGDKEPGFHNFVFILDCMFGSVSASSFIVG